MAPRSNPVDRRLGSFPSPQRDVLLQLWSILRDLVPDAEEAFAYGMPTLQVRGKNVVHLDGFAAHNGIFPSSGRVLGTVGAIPAWCRTAKGGLAFPIDRLPPRPLIRRIVAARLTELGAVRNGLRLDFARNGRLHAEGRVRDGELHGAWRWYRSDGSLKRTGRFSDGHQTGTWITYDHDGTEVRRTRLE